ncbi:MAG: aldehyde ferredoxin oxidoreductase, partial [Gammaproteobacteria bacterium]|nr:aldehyde ferredoxin oxidoreductase [Gammaproteobacteria bacterium]
INVTGITMMLTAQGADHTAGNVPTMDCKGKPLSELVAASLNSQINTAAADSLGLCVFGRSVTDSSTDLVMNAINDAHGTELDASFFVELGRQTLQLEQEFNQAAGFGIEDDELPGFFYNEPLSPTGGVAGFHSQDINRIMHDFWNQNCQ